jgi:hypothetical protein
MSTRQIIRALLSPLPRKALRRTSTGSPAGPAWATRSARAVWMFCAWLLLAGGLGAQATITSLSVSEATVGTRFDIAGSGFGTKTPAVFFVQAGEKVPKTTLKVIKPTADGLVTVEVKKAIVGTFTILLDPAGKNTPAAESTDTLAVVAPSILSLDEDNVGLPNAEVCMTVDQPGSAGQKVTVAGRKAKLVSIEALSRGGGASTTARVTFKVPKSVPNGTWDVMYSNAVGADVAVGGLVVFGSSKSLGKPSLQADITDLSRFKVSGKKVGVDTSFTGPTTVSGATGSKQGRTFSMVLPFVAGDSTAPVQYTAAPASLHYEQTQNGVTTLELMSTDDSFVIQVSAMKDGTVAGSFHGQLFPVNEGGAARDVSGTFTYDGRFSLIDTGGDTDTELNKGQPAPGLTIQVLALAGATGATGNAQPGDRLKVTYRLAKDDGSAWRLDEMGATRAAVSGPTFNYKRVIAQLSDVKDQSVDNGDGTYTYSFSMPLPDAYLPPLNDTDSFGPDDGELTGQPLLDGTYTMAFWFEWPYSVLGRSFKEVGTVAVDFLLGASVTTVLPRQVVTTSNCNQCHGELQFHGGGRRTNELCVMCHTAGAEDRNNPDVAGGTPGVTIEYSVMIHRIHNGAHLPSVHGVSTDAQGNRDYSVPPEPYLIVGFGDSIHDYSELEFPAWPNLQFPMPRDTGYADLDPSTEQPLENAIRGGVTDCELCHGDPDGDGPLQAPEHGDLAYTQLRRNTCGSCHDDWVFDRPYTSNLQTMPSQAGDASCNFCHLETGSNLATRDAHLHPLRNTSFAEGIHFDITDVSEAGDHDRDGTLDPGEKLAITMFIRDELGAAVDPTSLSQRNLAISGPSQNMNILLSQQAIPAEMLTGTQPFTFSPPMRVYFEIVGVATAGADEFQTAEIPHWNLSGHATEVRLRTGLGAGSTTLASEVDRSMNYVDVLDAAGFARDDYVVLDDGEMGEEYLQIQFVQGNRLWFSSPQSPAYAPGPLNEHATGATARVVTLVLLVEDTDYSLVEATGTLTELLDFGTGNTVLVTYSTDFIVPEVHPLALNAGPDLTEVNGSWAGKSLAGGTYSAFLWGARDLTLDLFGETNSYREGGAGERHDFLVGDATSVEPYALTTGADTCYSCHVDLSFHGNSRRGWETCLACHGTAASGDRTQYVAANAPATDGVTVNFREMVHKIHMGSELTNADSYTVVGFGSGYPDNFSEHTYEGVTFPKMPSGVQDCASCHGDGNTAWYEPANRNHPSEQTLPVQEWAVVCGACHDAPSSIAHIESQTSPVNGAESCIICHGQGTERAVDLVHLVR